MSDQLATQLRDIVDNGAPPITLAELELASTTALPPRARRRWPALAAAAAVALVVGAVVVAAVHDPGPNVAVQGGRGPAPASSAPIQVPDSGSTLVTSWAQLHVGYVFVYADGRVLWAKDGTPGPNGADAWERHLNAAGVDLVRSGDLAPSAFVAGNVPSNAWADPKKIGWTPSEYGACLWQSTSTSSGPFLGETDAVVARLPASARALLRTATKEDIAAPDGATIGTGVTCFRLTPQEARAARALPDNLIPAATNTPAIGVLILPALPHGKLLVWGG